MSLDPSWRVQEPTELLHIEQYANAGSYIGAISYGLHIAVYFATLHATRTTRGARLLAAAATLLFLGASLNMVGNGVGMQWAFIDYRNYPGGPSGFIMDVGDIWPNTLGNVGGCVVSWTADAVLLWRCYTVWGGRKVVVVVPALMWIASVVMGSLTTYQCAQPMQSLTTLSTINFALAFWAVSATLNMLLSALILTRLSRARRHVASEYTGATAMLIESAAPYAILAFVWIILYALQNLGMFFLLQLFVQVEAIAAELIILRITQGCAWTSKTAQELSSTASSRDRSSSRSEEMDVKEDA